VALFHTDYTDLQVSSFVGTSLQVGNAAKATTRGLELDGQWKINQDLALSASMGWLDTQYEEFEGAACSSAQLSSGDSAGVGGSQDISGEDLIFAPEITANMGLNYRAGLTDTLAFFWRLDVNYSDEFQIQQDQDTEDYVDSFVKLNASIGFGSADGKWAISLQGTNLTDENHRTYSFDAPAQAGTHVAFMTPPRMVAVKLSASF
jgi:outer membrane receptor protein involved in Fe transport